MTFHNPSGKGPILTVVAILFLGIFGSIFFFSFKECGKSGIFRSGKTSDATNLYQVFPAELNGNYYLISLEGVFKTRTYERNGGSTQRSGSTDIRLTLHDLEKGAQTDREVLGNYHEAYTKILGIGKNVFWLYNKKNGLHSRNILDLDIATAQENIITTNNQLSEGFAIAQDYLTNAEELYSYDKTADALMITTITGKRIWINATTFKTVDAIEVSGDKNDIDEIINEIVEKAMNGQTPELEKLYDEIIQRSSDVSAFTNVKHTANRLMGIDSCDYNLEGNTVKSIIKSNCKQPIIQKTTKINTTETFTKNQFIEGEFLINGISLNNNTALSLKSSQKTFYILHNDKISPDAQQIISKFNYENETVLWTFNITNEIGIQAEILRIYTLDDKIYFIFKTHPDLDDNFVCVALDDNMGKTIWNVKL